MIEEFNNFVWASVMNAVCLKFNLNTAGYDQNIYKISTRSFLHN